MKKSNINVRNLIILSSFAAVFSLCTLSAVGKDRQDVARAAEITPGPLFAETAEENVADISPEETPVTVEEPSDVIPEAAPVATEEQADAVSEASPETTAEDAAAAPEEVSQTTTEDVCVTPEETAAPPDQAAYLVTEFETPIRMYTTATVNVRTGAGTDYDKVTRLSWGSEATVTGQTSNGWFEVAMDGTLAFIRGDYMTADMPGTPYVFVGDSRTVQLKMAVGTTDKAYIAEVGEGYSYFKNTALPAISNYAGSGTKMIINCGVNDLANASKYISLVNNNIDAWTEAGITVYYAAVTPVGNCTSVTNAQIESFNAKLQSELDPRVKWIDGYSYLTQTGFSTPDGLHYNSDTYRSLYAYYMSVICGAAQASEL